jgi:hypothetical protein
MVAHSEKGKSEVIARADDLIVTNLGHSKKSAGFL